MALERDTKIDEVVEKMSERIAQGYYVAGQRLPSERELAEELDVSRVTIRAALLRLQADNLIDIIPRGGVFVRSTRRKALIANGPRQKQSSSFARVMQEQEELGRQARVRLLEPSSISPAGDEIGAKMEIAPDIQVLRRYRINLVDRLPYALLDSYYLASLFGDLLGQDEGFIPVFKWLREHTGLKAAYVLERLNFRMPSAEEAALLTISRGQSIVDMDRWVWANDETLFEYTHVVANGALHEFSYSYELDDQASQ